MSERPAKTFNPNVAVAGAALFVIAAGMAFVWLIQSYHNEAVYREMLRLAAIANVNIQDVDRVVDGMAANDAIATPLRAAAAVIFLAAIVAARVTLLLMSQLEQIEALKGQRWELQRQLQDRTLRLRENRQSLTKMQKVDGLTQVSNRQLVEDTIDREWRRAARVKGPMSLVLLDVDGMTEFNDLFGHIAGDRYLKLLADELNKLCGRPTDVVGRFQDDVFALILGSTDAKGAAVIGEASRKCAHAAIGLLDEQPNGLLTVSVCAVTARPQPGSEANTLLLEAHGGIDQAKKNGGDTVVYRSV